MTARLLTVACATPGPPWPQSDAVEVVVRSTNATPKRARAIAALHDRSGVDERHMALMTPRGLYDHTDPPTTADRLRAVATAAPALAHAACDRALVTAPIDAPAITHLITVSCTALGAPGVDRSLIGSLGLRPTVERTNVAFMGCHGAINGLRVARAIANADPNAAVLVCCIEICSGHLQHGVRPGAASANALFADGAAACVITGADHGGSGGSGGSGVAARIPVLDATGSVMIPGSEDAMRWTVGDHGFEMTLRSDVPELLEAHVGAWVSAWLHDHGAAQHEIRGWGVHPGGPRILDAVGRSIGLDHGALDDSREILRTHGNMSSPTVLFVLERLLRDGALPAVLLAFGPGLCGEAILLR